MRAHHLRSSDRWRTTRRRFFGLGLGVVAAATLASRAPWVALAAQGASGAIALPRGRDIALVRADGSDDRTILSLRPGEFIADVALSPDGTRVAFGLFTAGTSGPGGSDIVVAPTDPASGAQTVIVPRDRPGMLLAAPCWSSDGSGLAFEGIGLGVDGKSVVFSDTVAADGSDRRRLVEDGRYPALSPDGREVAFVRSKPTGDSLFARALDGGPEREILSEEQFVSISGPRYSPDGSAIAFAGTYDRPTTSPKLIGADSLGAGDVRSVAGHGFPADAFVVTPSGADVRMAAQLSYDDLSLCWSPDGNWLAVSGAAGLKLVHMADGAIQPRHCERQFRGDRLALSGGFGQPRQVRWRSVARSSAVTAPVLSSTFQVPPVIARRTVQVGGSKVTCARFISA